MDDISKKKESGKNKKKMLIKILCWIFFICIILILGVVAINLNIVMKEKNKILSIEEASNLNADCIIVLGAGIRKDNSPTWILEDRLIVADKLYKNGASKKLLMSGDHGSQEHNEVRVMRDYSLNEGVPIEDIFMDHAGFETYDTMYRAKEVFGAKKVIIVTQEYHMYRALYIADKLGLDAYGVTSDLRFYSKKMAYWKFREYFARVKSFIKCITKPEPKYLGSPIDLKASGTVTNDEE